LTKLLLLVLKKKIKDVALLISVFVNFILFQDDHKPGMIREFSERGKLGKF